MPSIERTHLANKEQSCDTADELLSLTLAVWEGTPIEDNGITDEELERHLGEAERQRTSGSLSRCYLILRRRMVLGN
jgi:hypothetical protein